MIDFESGINEKANMKGTRVLIGTSNMLTISLLAWSGPAMNDWPAGGSCPQWSWWATQSPLLALGPPLILPRGWPPRPCRSRARCGWWSMRRLILWGRSAPPRWLHARCSCRWRPHRPSAGTDSRPQFRSWVLRAWRTRLCAWSGSRQAGQPPRPSSSSALCRSIGSWAGSELRTARRSVPAEDCYQQSQGRRCGPWWALCRTRSRLDSVRPQHWSQSVSRFPTASSLEWEWCTGTGSSPRRRVCAPSCTPPTRIAGGRARVPHCDQPRCSPGSAECPCSRSWSTPRSGWPGRPVRNRRLCPPKVESWGTWSEWNWQPLRSRHSRHWTEKENKAVSHGVTGEHAQSV